MRKANMTLIYSDISYETVTAAVKIDAKKNVLPAEVIKIDLSLNRAVKTVSDSINNWLRFLNVRIVGNVNIVVTSRNNLNYISTLPKLRKAQFEDHALQEIKESFKEIDYFYKQDIIERGDLGTFVYTHLISNEIYHYLTEISKALKLKHEETPITIYDLMFKAAKRNDFTEGLVFYFSNGEFYLSLVVNDTWIDGIHIKDIKDHKKIVSRVNLFLLRHRSNLNLSLDNNFVITVKKSKNKEVINELIKKLNLINVKEVIEKLEYSINDSFKAYKKIKL